MFEKIITTLTILSIIKLTGCEAPHHNPFDPENPNKILTYIEGVVFTYSIPRKPITDAMIIWSPHNKAIFTNNSGYFKIETNSKENGWLIVRKEGFKSDSIYVNLSSSNTYKEFFLNQIPRLDSLEFYSVLINSYPNIKDIHLQIRARIIDSDNDIDSVFICNDDLDTRIQLNYNVQSRFYEGNFTDYDFGVDDLSELIGLDCYINVKDKFGDEFRIGSDRLKRIIKEEMVLETPINFDSTSSKPRLQWRRFVPGFRFTYEVELFNDNFPPSVIWSKKDLSMDTTYVDVDVDLPTGNYYWVLWCVDSFLNRARSKPASFRVK